MTNQTSLLNTGGTVTVDTASLEFSGHPASNSNVSYWQDSKGGTTTLKNGAKLIVDYGMIQAAGTLAIADGAGETIKGINAGSSFQFTGGKITFPGGATFGKLTFDTSGSTNIPLLLQGTVEIDMKIDGNAGKSNDQIVTGGGCTIGGSAKLVVTNAGSGLTAGLVWDLIDNSQAGTNKAISGDFALGNASLPTGTSEDKTKLADGFWELKS